MQHHPNRLVIGQTELALQQQGRYTPLVCGHQIGGPKAMGQGNLGPVEDGSGSAKLGADSLHIVAVSRWPVRTLARFRIEGK
jgi:hypothetical protein